MDRFAQNTGLGSARYTIFSQSLHFYVTYLNAQIRGTMLNKQAVPSFMTMVVAINVVQGSPRLLTTSSPLHGPTERRCGGMHALNRPTHQRPSLDTLAP